MRPAVIVAASLCALAAGCASNGTSASAPPTQADGPTGLMTIDSGTANPGQVVSLSFRGPEDRGVDFQLDAWTDSAWHHAYHLTAGSADEPPTWNKIDDENATGGTAGVDVLGSGPSQVKIPEVAEPGTYQICTDATAQRSCVLVHVTAP